MRKIGKALLIPSARLAHTLALGTHRRMLLDLLTEVEVLNRFEVVYHAENNDAHVVARRHTIVARNTVVCPDEIPRDVDAHRVGHLVFTRIHRIVERRGDHG